MEILGWLPDFTVCPGARPESRISAAGRKCKKLRTVWIWQRKQTNDPMVALGSTGSYVNLWSFVAGLYPPPTLLTLNNQGSHTRVKNHDDVTTSIYL